METLKAFWSGRRVFITGHTGFKGGWLSLWLSSLGAEVHGFALEPSTAPSLFDAARVSAAIASSTIADIRDYAALQQALAAARPEVVLHLAARALVRDSYQHPVDAYGVNVMGVVHLLEAVRSVSGVRAVVNVTSDKCYENREWLWAYREDEPVGGRDPYSSSKACAELVTGAYRQSFMAAAGVAVASARAGNVIGGGDWSPDRLVPDALRAIDAHHALSVRFPEAIRPWQHVLEPLAGYLSLAQALHTHGGAFAEAWNFGPADDEARTVAWVVDYLAAQQAGVSWSHDAASHPHEARYLKLDSTKARVRLGWRPRWRVEGALDKTLAWHLAWRAGRDARATTLAQIDDYVRTSTEPAGVTV